MVNIFRRSPASCQRAITTPATARLQEIPNHLCNGEARAHAQAASSSSEEARASQNGGSTTGVTNENASYMIRLYRWRLLRVEACITEQTRKALTEAAIGCRPDYEFIAASIKSHSDGQYTVYECASQACSAARYMCTFKSDSSMQLFEAHAHEGKHAPVTRCHYPWSSAQIEVMKQVPLQSTPMDVLAELKKHRLVRGCTEKEVAGWLRRERSKSQLPNPRSTITKLKDKLKALEMSTGWNDLVERAQQPDFPQHGDLQKTLLLPLRAGEQYVYSGADALAKQNKDHPVTTDGTPYVWSFTLTTVGLLYNRIRAQDRSFSRLSSVTSKGPKFTSVTGHGLTHIDGVMNVVDSAVVFPIGGRHR